MSGDGIEHGDIVVVRHQETAEPREIAVVLVPGGGPVIKRLHTTTDGIRLLSSNPSFPPLPVSDPDQLRVQGVVVGIARE